MELTEPWKSLDLPVDGAVVLASTPTGVVLRFVAIPAEDYKTVHAALRAHLVAAGWATQDDPLPRMETTAFTLAGRELLLNTKVRDGRPVASLTALE